jgi:hypothetical protein
MANGYVVKDLIKQGASVSASASSTTDLTGTFRMSGEDSKNILVRATWSAVGETTGISVVLQDSPDGSTWSTVQTATITSVANVDTITFATKAGTTAGDYVVVYDVNGLGWAIAADVTGSDAAPTGAIWTAIPAGRKAQADISGDTSAADVAARFETAFDALSGFTALIVTDDTAADGTMTFTSVIAGVDNDAPVPKDDDDAGAGSITIAETTDGSFTSTNELENNIADGTDTATWSLGRVVVTTGTGDTITASEVLVTRRL